MDFEFTVNSFAGGTVEFGSEGNPTHEELLFLLPRNAHDGMAFARLVLAVAYAKTHPNEYDGGRSGKQFYELRDLGVVQFNSQGGLLVPEKALGELSSYDGGLLLRRTREIDAMAFALAKSIQGHAVARAELNTVVKNLKKALT